MSVVRNDTATPHVFIHVPKTGGTSIEVLPWVGGNGHRGHWQYCRLLRSGIEDFLVWGVVRSPERRLLSAWRGFRQHPGEDVTDLMAFDTPDEWVAWLAADRRRTGWHHHTRTQLSFLEPLGRVLLVPYLEGANIADNWLFADIHAQVTGRATAPEVGVRNTGTDEGETLSDASLATIDGLYGDDRRLYGMVLEAYQKGKRPWISL